MRLSPCTAVSAGSPDSLTPCGHAGSSAKIITVNLTLCILLWARPGAEDGLIAYEDQVLAMAADHQGRVLQRVRGGGANGQPLEVQLLEVASAHALGEVMAAPRRRSLTA